MKRKPSRRPRATRGGLTLIAALLAGSALVRLGAGPGEAIAREVADFDSGDSGLSTAGCRTPEDVTLALAALEEREGRLAEEEAEIAARMALVEEAEAALQTTLAELEAAEADLNATLSVAATAAEDDLAKLTAVYETMKPAEAAALFSQMDADFAAGFLGRMRPEAAAAVMAGLDPQTAYAISIVLAGRNADVPRN